MKNTITNFTFLPNLKPLTTLTNEAKKLYKSGQASSLSQAKNVLAKDEFNKPYNKLVNGLKEASPILVDDVLYVPFLITSEKNSDLPDGESFYYYMVMTNDCVAGGFGLHVGLSQYAPDFDIKELKISQIHKKPTGWYIELNSEYGVEFNQADESIFFELVFDDGESYESIESSYIEYSEVFSDMGGYSSIKDQEITDLKAAYVLGSEGADFESKLYSIGGIECSFYGTWTIESNGEFLTPEQVISDLTIENRVQDFWDWMHSGRPEGFMDYQLAEGEATPYFGYMTEEGDYIDDVFDELPKTLTEKAFHLAEYFL